MARGATIASACTGAFVLAAAGLLDGRRATTHWLYAPLLASLYPQLTVEADQLYIQDGPIITSAGSAAVIDLWGVTPDQYRRAFRLTEPDTLTPFCNAHH